MNIIEMDSKIKEPRELRRMADELQAEIATRFMKQTTARRLVLA